MEKAENLYLKIYMAFIDCSWALDSVVQKLFLQSPKDQRVQDKYIRKIKDIYIHICAKIKIEYEWKKFRLERGGKEGEPISPNLYTCLLEQASIFIKGREQQTLP